jgi:uncharacterized protein YndB with AHSA1/START domain
MNVIRPAPVRQSIAVKASQARAFEVFTRDIAKWWPASHHIGKAEMKAPMLEPCAGGRWYETGVDGSTCEWGKVLVWEPPARLVLAWQISADFKYDPNLVTEVEVTFTDAGNGMTRVDLEHRNLERFADKAESFAASVTSGWGLLLGLYGKTV